MIETGIKLIQVRLYDGLHPDNYALSFYVFKDGERGVISGLHGDLFYKNVVAVFQRLRDEYGINIIHGSVTKAHARLIRMYSPGFSVRYEPTAGEGGRTNMVWITASLVTGGLSST